MPSKALTKTDKKEIKITKKFEKWCKLFLKEDSETYGNATGSALKAYGAKSYNSAGVIGHENLKKLKNLGLLFSEKEGISAKEWHRVLAAKALKGSFEQTKEYMQIIGLLDIAPAGTNNNFQFNFGDLAATFTKQRKDRGLPVEDQ